MPMYKRSLFVVLLLAAFVFLGSIYGYYESGNEKAADPGLREDSAEMVTVYVSGAVSKPGVVRLRSDARVIEAVDLCGGLLPGADEGRINMAQPLKDGMKISVPEQGAGPGSPSGQPADMAGKVNINTADVKALDDLPGVGPATARKIIEYREKEGSFATIEDLKKVQGIGEMKFSRLKDRITT